jgi:hypothetical protein
MRFVTAVTDLDADQRVSVIAGSVELLKPDGDCPPVRCHAESISF